MKKRGNKRERKYIYIRRRKGKRKGKEKKKIGFTCCMFVKNKIRISYKLLSTLPPPPYMPYSSFTFIINSSFVETATILVPANLE